MLKLIKIKTSENWYIRGTVKGRGVYKSTGTSRRDIADEERRTLEERLLSGSETFGVAAGRYIKGGGSPKFLLTRDENKKFTGVLGQFENTSLAEIGQNEVDEAARKAFPNVKPQTLNRQFYTPFIAVWNFAVRADLCQRKEWRRPRVKRSDLKKIGDYPLDTGTIV